MNIQEKINEYASVYRERRVVFVSSDASLQDIIDIANFFYSGKLDEVSFDVYLDNGGGIRLHQKVDTNQ